MIHSDAKWRSILGETRYGVMREKKTERAFSGEHLHRTDPGIYACAACAHPLFKSEDKYNAGSGWPSFTQPIESKSVYYSPDLKGPVQRYEVLCRGCDSYLGHVFHDGPPPRLLRYCINSVALQYKK